MRKKVVLLLAVAVIVIGGGVWLHGRMVRCRPPQLTVIDDPAELDDLHLDLPQLETESWVRRYNPKKSFAGFNLGLYRQRVPIIFDMQGRIVHSWPGVRAVDRVRLDHQGRLAVIGADSLVKEYDWDGNLTWHYQLPDTHYLPHHDLIVMVNGNFLILVHDGHSHADYLYEVNRGGEVVWQWRSVDHRGTFPAWDESGNDPTHCNSIRELPPNRWFADGDERFRPGNILVSSRSLSTLFIIDRSSGEVVWQYSGDLDHQHEAAMIEDGQSGAGLIMVVNNGRDSIHAYRRTRVQAINPVSGTVDWEYGSKYFYSTIGGTAQILPNSNVLITSSHGGRAFEIRPRGKIVWEWAPPFKPMRLLRLALDHCPQLAAFVPQDAREVVADDARPFVDDDLFGFALPGEVERRKVAGHEREVAPENKGCREILVPPDAILRVEYGIDRDLERPEWLEGRFELWIRGGGDDRKLVDANLGGSVDAWYRSGTTISLADLAYRKVEICLEASVVEGNQDEVDQLVWGNPVIESTSQLQRDPQPAKTITEQERQLQERQLKALGYVD